MDEHELYTKAMDTALNYLSYGMRTKRQVTDKLKQRKIASKEISLVMMRLKELGYIDDANYTALFIKEKSSLKGWGPKKIQDELYKRGVSGELQKTLLKELMPEKVELELARQTAKKKMVSSKLRSKEQIYRQLGAFLTRRGYSYGVVSEVVREVIGELGDEE